MDPVGRYFRESDSDSARYEIVGIAGDARNETLRKPAEPTVYLPFRGGSAHFQIRTTSRAKTLISFVRDTVTQVAANLAPSDVMTEAEQIDQSLFSERLLARVSSVFGFLVLILSAVGLYGLLSNEVTRRTRELGIRTALGGQRLDILQMVAGKGLLLTAIGAVIGACVAFWLTSYLRSFLYGVHGIDLLTFAIVAILFLAVALVGGYLPARRAMNVDPIVAIRHG